MTFKRVLALFLVFSFCLVPLWSCGDDGRDDIDGGGLNDDGSVNWDEVDFKGIKEMSNHTKEPDDYLVWSYAKKYILRLYETQVRKNLGLRQIKISIKEMDEMANRSDRCKTVSKFFSSVEFNVFLANFFKNEDI